MLDEVLEIHKKNVGVLRMETTEAVQDDQDLAKMYTPGVAELSLMIEKNHALARELTISGKLVAVISRCQCDSISHRTKISRRDCTNNCQFAK